MKFIRKGILSAAVASVFLLNFSCVSQPQFFNRGSVDRGTEKIAVLPFTDYNQKEGNNSGELVRSLFESTLLSRGFKVIELEKAAADYDSNGQESLTSKWIMEKGAAAGADFVLYGSIHDYRTYQSATSFLYLFSWLEITSSVGVTARLVSSRTGEVVWSGSLTRASYTFNDAAAETVRDLVRTIKLKSPQP